MGTLVVIRLIRHCLSYDRLRPTALHGDETEMHGFGSRSGWVNRLQLRICEKSWIVTSLGCSIAVVALAGDWWRLLAYNYLSIRCVSPSVSSHTEVIIVIKMSAEPVHWADPIAIVPLPASGSVPYRFSYLLASLTFCAWLFCDPTHQLYMAVNLTGVLASIILAYLGLKK